VRVEAICWVLNLAPVPDDRSGQRSIACKFVPVGLANHAGPHGMGAFPSVATLVRCTGLSERTVRTCLDRLQAQGIIRPCDPDARRQRDSEDLAALAGDHQGPVAALDAQVLDVSAGGVLIRLVRLVPSLLCTVVTTGSCSAGPRRRRSGAGVARCRADQGALTFHGTDGMVG